MAARAAVQDWSTNAKPTERLTCLLHRVNNCQTIGKVTNVITIEVAVGGEVADNFRANALACNGACLKAARIGERNHHIVNVADVAFSVVVEVAHNCVTSIQSCACATNNTIREEVVGASGAITVDGADNSCRDLTRAIDPGRRNRAVCLVICVYVGVVAADLQRKRSVRCPAESP